MCLLWPSGPSGASRALLEEMPPDLKRQTHADIDTSCSHLIYFLIFFVSSCLSIFHRFTQFTAYSCLYIHVPKRPFVYMYEYVYIYIYSKNKHK